MGELFGVLAEFELPETLLAAARAAYAAGYRKMDAHTPFPVHGLARELGYYRTWMAPAVLAGGLFGGTLAYSMQYFAMAVHYPLNVGGRPLHSWPSLVPVTFELTVLLASIGGLLAMLALNGFPRPHHPVFGAEGFERASIDRFFLCIEADDSQFRRETVMTFLMDHGATRVSEVFM